MSRGTRRVLKSEEAVGFALALGGAVCFGTLAIFGKLAYRVDAKPLPLLATRFATATLILVAFQLISTRRLAIERRTLVKLLLLGGLGYGLEASLYFLALDRAPAGVVTVIFYSYPMWTSIIGLALGMERWHTRVAVALVLSSVGVVYMFRIRQVDVDGPLLALAAAVAVAVYFILSDVVLRDARPHEVATWTTAGAALATAGAATIGGAGLPLAALPYAGALGLASAVSFLLLYAAIIRIGPARAAIANMMEVVTTVLLAAVVLGESITTRKALGALLVISALPILATALPRRIEERPPADSP
jgi:drug/metabolite transporter (DMT)-like permease